MKKGLIISILTLAALSIFGQDLSTKDWRTDLVFFRDQLEEYHNAPYNFISKKEFEKKYQNLYENIPELDESEIKVRLVQLAASLGDGHTNIRPYDSFKSFPVRFFWFNDELRVVKAGKDYQEILGGKVERIGDTPISVAYEKVKKLIPQNESEMFDLGWSQALLRMSEPLTAFGLIKNNDRLPLTISKDDGSVQEVEIILHEVETNELIWAYKEVPRFLQDRSTPYYEWLSEEKKILYFNFETYPEWNEFKDFGIGLIRFIAQNKVKTLVVDLRRNGGGDFKKGLKLIEELNNRIGFSEKGKTYVLIGRYTFSAGMSNATHFKKMMGGVLVGETTGARPNGYQENHAFELPNSKIPASVAQEYYEFSDNDTAGLFPDVEILPEYKWYVQGRDPVLEWVLHEEE